MILYLTLRALDSGEIESTILMLKIGLLKALSMTCGYESDFIADVIRFTMLASSELPERLKADNTDFHLHCEYLSITRMFWQDLKDNA
ncbi:hypothetical protein Tco_0542450 [Tanacetum coccineum]